MLLVLDITNEYVKSYKYFCASEETEKQSIETNVNENSLPREQKYVGSHPKELILGDPSQGIRTRSKYREEINHIAFVSQIEPHNLDEAESDPNWMMAMHEELNELKRNNVWTLVDRPSNHPIIGTKWVFRNKVNELGEITGNKARLVAQGYNQQ